MNSEAFNQQILQQQIEQLSRMMIIFMKESQPLEVREEWGQTHLQSITDNIEVVEMTWTILIAFYKMKWDLTNKPTHQQNSTNLLHLLFITSQQCKCLLDPQNLHKVCLDQHQEQAKNATLSSSEGAHFKMDKQV